MMMTSVVGWALSGFGILMLLIGILPVTVPVNMRKGTGFRRASWIMTGVGVLAIALGQIIPAALGTT